MKAHGIACKWSPLFVQRILPSSNVKMFIKKTRECHNHKPQPTSDTKRKRKMTKLTRTKQTKKCTRSTQSSSLFPKRGDHKAPKTCLQQPFSITVSGRMIFYKTKQSHVLRCCPVFKRNWNDVTSVNSNLTTQFTLYIHII